MCSDSQEKSLRACRCQNVLQLRSSLNYVSGDEEWDGIKFQKLMFV